jgi:hypothetical protein
LIIVVIFTMLVERPAEWNESSFADSHQFFIKSSSKKRTNNQQSAGSQRNLQKLLGAVALN